MYLKGKLASGAQPMQFIVYVDWIVQEYQSPFPEVEIFFMYTFPNQSKKVAKICMSTVYKKLEVAHFKKMKRIRKSK